MDRHPTVKMLALSFLLMIGVMLIAEGFDHHIPKGYVYFAMAFSVFVEVLNLRMRKVAQPGAPAPAVRGRGRRDPAREGVIAGWRGAGTATG